MSPRLIALCLPLFASLSFCNFSDTRQNDDESGGPRPQADATPAPTPDSSEGTTPAPSDGTTTPPPPATTSAYPRLQAELFNASCARCHNPGRSAGGVDLTTFAPVVGGRTSSGSSTIKPGNPDNSEIYEQVSTGQMPPSGAVAPALVQALKCWIEKGAPQAGAGECFSTGVTP